MIFDSSFLIDISRGTDEAANKKAEELAEGIETKTISTVTVMELWKGACKHSNSAQEKKRVNDLISSLHHYAFDTEIARLAGSLEEDLRKNGIHIGLEDVMIAATALAKNEVVLTRNVKHFSKVPGLQVESY